MTPDEIYQILGQRPIKVVDNGTIFNIYYEGNLCQSYNKNNLLRILLKELK